MPKALLIARQTWLQSVRHPAFLTFTVGLPVSILALVTFAGLMTAQFLWSDQRPIGYVDETGWLPSAEAWIAAHPDVGNVPMLVFTNEPDAVQAYASGKIQAYYVVAADYVATGYVKQVSTGLSALRVQAQFESFLRDGLLQSAPPEYRDRIANGTALLHRSLLTGSETLLQNYIQWGVAGFVVLTFWLINSTASSDALYALHDEEKQHAIETSLTSASSAQFIGGKALGVVAAGFTQFAVWGGLAAIVLGVVLILLARTGIELSLAPVWSILGISLSLSLPGFAMNVTGLILFSALAELAGRGERLVWLVINVSALLAGPLTYAALRAPDHPASVALSLIPFSAPLVMVARYAQVSVPAWQVGLSLILVWGAALFNILFVARVYRAKWLMAGQKDWRKALRLAFTR